VTGADGHFACIAHADTLMRVQPHSQLTQTLVTESSELAGIRHPCVAGAVVLGATESKPTLTKSGACSRTSSLKSAFSDLDSPHEETARSLVRLIGILRLYLGPIDLRYCGEGLTLEGLGNHRENRILDQRLGHELDTMDFKIFKRTHLPGGLHCHPGMR
jgi:hypothetical protein